MKGVLQYVVVAVAGIGLYLAAYFTLVYYRFIEANTKLVPSVCRLEERTCQTVLSTRFARIFGVPNSLLGAIYYLAVIVVILGGWTAPPIESALIFVAWFTVAFSLLLAYSLIFIIKIPCPVCFAGHAINLALALLLTFGLS